MLLSFVKNKKIALLGIGRSTLSTYNFLYKKGFSLYIWDDNPEVRTNYKNSSFNIVNITHWDYSSLDAIVTSPGIPLYYPKPHYIVNKIKLYSIPILTDIELFYYFFPNYKYIGITGSNGKSTLSTLLYSIFTLAGKSVVLAGNIGIPVFNLVNLPLDTYVILELSSFQLCYLKKMKLDIAILLNIYPNHNDYHGGYLNYQQSKFNIFKNQTANNVSVINLDDEYIKNLFALNVLNSQVVTISPTGKNNANYFFKYNKLYKKNFSDSNSYLIHNFTNYTNTSIGFLQLILFAYAICDLLNIDINILIKTLKHFKGLPNRQEVVAVKNNVIFINDSKATTPSAAAYALEKYNNIYWLVGGVRKSGDFSICEPYFYKIKHVFIFGRDKSSFAKEFKDKVNFSCYNTLKDATVAAFEAIKKDLVHISKATVTKDNVSSKVVLLSPVGASFDEFKNFEYRGKFFKKVVKELINATI